MKTFLVVKSNNTPFNILVSFAWLGGSGNFTNNLFNESKRGNVNLMIDSGAFTLFNAKKTNYKHINIDNYCNFLSVYGEYCEKYVMLDKIGNHEESKENYEEMLSRGLNPMFVFTMFDNDYDYLRQAVSHNPHVCVAGGVTTKSDWIIKRYQDVYKETQALIHGLGFVTYPKMYQLPLHSVDSSSWAQGAQMYGNLMYFDNGMKSVAYKDILTKKRKMPTKLIETMEMLKMTPKQFSNLENHKGGDNIGTLLSIVANLEYQKVSKRLGLDLFLSIGNDNQFQHMLYINDKLNEGTLTYEKYRNRKKNCS